MVTDYDSLIEGKDDARLQLELRAQARRLADVAANLETLRQRAEEEEEERDALRAGSTTTPDEAEVAGVAPVPAPPKE